MSIDVSKCVKQISYNGNDVPLASAANTATITINIEGYTNPKYATVFYTNTEGELKSIDSRTPINFPLTITTLVNSGMCVLPSGWGGILSVKNRVGCYVEGSATTWYITPTSANASLTFYDND